MGIIFVSCGQYTEAEKSLGRAIREVVKAVTGLDAFFAEDVQDLNGLESNILDALHDSIAFVTVMHPRGKITRPDGSVHIRASVWIEQEIAIATYIQLVEKRSLPVIAFAHELVDSEGIRDVLHLNPILFRNDSEILPILRERLLPWNSLRASGVRVQIQSGNRKLQEGHWTRQLTVSLINDSGQRIEKLTSEIRLPAGILKHWSSFINGEVKSSDTRYRYFRRDESETGTVQPHDTAVLLRLDYCPKCALDDAGGVQDLVSHATVESTVWIDGRKYNAKRTIQELAEDADELV
jgi:hypothetical protein